jgi:hypothetical protein
MTKTLLETYKEIKALEEAKKMTAEETDDAEEDFEGDEMAGKKKKEVIKESDEDEDDMDSDDEEDCAEDKKEAAIKESREAIENLLGEEKLSKVLQAKIAALVEAAISERVSIFEEALRSEYRVEMDNYETNMNEQVDKYLTLIAEEFVSENEIAIESGIKVQLAESLLRGMTDLLENNNINVPEEKFVALDELQEENQKLKNSYAKSFDTNIKLKSNIEYLNKQLVIESVTKNLTATQKDKLIQLTENVSAEDAEEFADSCKSVISKFILNETAKRASTDELLTEEATKEEVSAKSGDTKVNAYASFMSKNRK